MLVSNPPVELNPNVLMLGTARYPLYLVKGQNEGILFEGGVGAMGPVLREQLAELNLAPGFVKQAVVTHAHPDHVMAVPMFRELFPGISVLAADIAAKTLANEKAVSFFGKIDGAFTSALLKMGVIGEKHQPAPLAEPAIAVDRILKEGDTIAAEPLRFQVIETPGHSDCHLSFHEPDAGILLVSDATGYYMPDLQEWWPNYFTSYEVYLNSMKRLAALNAEVLCLGHNAAIAGAEDVKAYLKSAIAATENYHTGIVAEIKKGVPARELAERLGQAVYDQAPLLPLDFFQKNCGLMIKLSMKHEGLAEA